MEVNELVKIVVIPIATQFCTAVTRVSGLPKHRGSLENLKSRLSGRCMDPVGQRFSKDFGWSGMKWAISAICYGFSHQLLYLPIRNENLNSAQDHVPQSTLRIVPHHSNFRGKNPMLTFADHRATTTQFLFRASCNVASNLCISHHPRCIRMILSPQLLL